MPSRKPQLVTAPRTVIGYHSCSQEAAEQILAEQRFLPSTKTYDWLGEGVYFWEYAPYRALDWAILRCARLGGEPAVLRATIRFQDSEQGSYTAFCSRCGLHKICLFGRIPIG